MIEIRIPIMDESILLPFAGEIIESALVFKYKGDELKHNMYRVGFIVSKLLENNWTVVADFESLVAYKEEINSIEEVKIELKNLGISLRGIAITEYQDEY